MSFIAIESSPRPSPSPVGKPESSKRALKDSMWGATNSFRIGATEAFFGGYLNNCSRARVLNVGVRLPCPDPSGIVFRGDQYTCRIEKNMRAWSHDHFRGVRNFEAVFCSDANCPVPIFTVDHDDNDQHILFAQCSALEMSHLRGLIHSKTNSLNSHLPLAKQALLALREVSVCST
jgi:hypothetical protein